MKKKNEKNNYLDKNGKFNFGKCINWNRINNMSKEETKTVYNILKNVK